MTDLTRRTALGLLAGAAILPGRAMAQGASGLPDTISWTAYDVGSGSYNQGVAVGNAIKTKLGANLRLLPGRNDVARLVPLKAGQAMFSANGVAGAYFAQEGMFDFNTKEWGPQPVRAIIMNNGDALLSLVTAKDANIQTYADLKGKRVAWVHAADSLNIGTEACMAFGGVTWNDVQKVEFPGFGASMQALLAGRVDAAFASSISGPLYQLESSPRGIHYPPMPHGDNEGWARLHKKAPYFVRATGREGAGISADRPVEAGSYPFPILMSLGGIADPVGYAMAKAMVELFPDYRDAAPGNSGWDIKRQEFSWVVPYHEGAVRYFKEIKAWTDAHETNNQNLLKRQAVLAEAWKKLSASAPADEAAYKAAWLKARAESLQAAGMEPVWS
jgi:TRAP transporter TAXI family solute receptor